LSYMEKKHITRDAIIVSFSFQFSHRLDVPFDNIVAGRSCVLLARFAARYGGRDRYQRAFWAGATVTEGSQILIHRPKNLRE
jgi:hypothetical protein